MPANRECSGVARMALGEHGAVVRAQLGRVASKAHAAGGRQIQVAMD
jgi:hypothetical protein